MCIRDRIHSDLENSSPVVEIRVDALKAQAAGLSASKIGSAVHNAISGVESTEIEIDGNDIDVKVEYSDEDNKTIDQVKGLVLTTGSGGSVALTDVADVQFVDSPASISREDKEYKVTISGEYTAVSYTHLDVYKRQHHNIGYDQVDMFLIKDVPCLLSVGSQNCLISGFV